MNEGSDLSSENNKKMKSKYILTIITIVQNQLKLSPIYFKQHTMPDHRKVHGTHLEQIFWTTENKYLYMCMKKAF